MNLIRFVPAKGQDATFMATSLYLAKLIGPILIAIGAGMLINTRVYQAMVYDFLRNHVLIYLSGLLSMAAGLAIVMAHNVWIKDWPLIITLLGWAASIGGALRIVSPQTIENLGNRILTHKSLMVLGGIVVLGLGLALGYFGYFA